jgi:hypothetical protein
VALRTGEPLGLDRSSRLAVRPTAATSSATRQHTGNYDFQQNAPPHTPRTLHALEDVYQTGTALTA